MFGKIWKQLLIVAGGILVAVVGIGMYSSASGAEVKCGSDIMYQGDICKETNTKTGAVVERSYDEQRAQNIQSSYVAIGVGGLITLVGVGLAVREATRKTPDQSTQVGVVPMA